jgi:hypothetical protein
MLQMLFNDRSNSDSLEDWNNVDTSGQRFVDFAHHAQERTQTEVRWTNVVG